MKNKKITCTLSTKSFRDAAEKIKTARNELERKCNSFLKTVADQGIKIVKAELRPHNKGEGETIGSVHAVRDGNAIAIQVTSDAILFLEFGSGIPGIGTAPHAAQFGYGSGTYPGEGHWDDTDVWVRYAPNSEPIYHEYGWVYYKNGRKHFSEGMVASMPMYNSARQLEDVIVKLAKEVF